MELFRFELPEEDTLVFKLTDAFRQTSEHELIEQLRQYIERHDERVGAADEGRPAEMESLSTDFARLLLTRLESGRTPPQQKSYHLQS